jgi:serine phosphatase RsbU (regulator of sigma subunit)
VLTIDFKPKRNFDLMMQKQKRFRSIRTKLISLFSFSAFIAIVLLSITMLFNTYQELEKREKVFLQNTQDILLQNLMAPIEFDDEYSATLLLETLQRDKDIKGAFIFVKNSVFASYTQTKEDEKNLKSRAEDLFKKYTKESSFILKDSSYITAGKSIFAEKTHVATFIIFSSTDSLNESIESQFFLTLIISGIIFLIMVFLAFMFQTLFTQPLFKLGTFMKRVRENQDYSLRLKHNNNDEFGVVFDGFNTMLSTIEEQNQNMKNAKLEIEAIHKNTQASIEYAAMIQDALIPKDEHFNNFFKEYFTLWDPRDMVGGDIYLLQELRGGDECVIMYIDCTGHGVPGAFVTMLVKALERQVISEINLTKDAVSPSRILSFFNRSMKQLLKQESKDSLSNVGFDGGILYYNKREKMVRYSGAETSLFYTKDGELKEIKGDRYSVGYKKCDTDYTYTEYTIKVKEGMNFYLSTDGYLDQNGGEKSFSFGKRRFIKLIEENYDKDMSQQKELFLEALASYQGEEERNDDITLIGIKI